MAHWAEINKNNIVVRVLVGNNDDPAGDEGYSWLINNLGGRWIQTSYNGNIRANYAGVGFLYNEELDVFIAPKPFNSWVINKQTIEWEPPIPRPDSGFWEWDENTLSWNEFEESFSSSDEPE